ncbi:OB-fold protein [Winogradskyella schleiferi]|uniref:OB-fold protein n=1 Tax=Winogradskyella schleiferi TaxID=2686078 RepID=UPI0015BD4A43|nr:hypothetical protein [Winogradskyella schleiferi]
MLKKLIIFGILIISVIAGYNYIFQDHRTIEDETAEFIISASAIGNQFSNDLKTAEATYLNKTIEVSGRISEINTTEVTLDDKVFCQFSEALEASIQQNSKLKIKGRVIGYDDLLEQVKLDQCTIINTKN